MNLIDIPLRSMHLEYPDKTRSYDVQRGVLTRPHAPSRAWMVVDEFVPLAFLAEPHTIRLESLDDRTFVGSGRVSSIRRAPNGVTSILTILFTEGVEEQE